jgi:hypothetical protein
MLRASAVRFLAVCLVAAALAGCGAVPLGRQAMLAPSAAVVRPRVVSGAQLGRELAAAAVGSGSAHVTMQVARAYGQFGPQQATGAVRFAGPAAGAAYDLEATGQRLRVVVLGGSAYVRGLPTRMRGRPWLQFDAASLSGSLLTQIVEDPAAVGYYGRGLSFTDSGSSSVPGTRQYTGRLTTEQWLAAVDESLRPEVRAWAKDHGVTGATILVFVDRSGLPVKQIFMLVPNSAEVTIQLEFSRWGEPVSITAPPQRKVALCSEARLCPKPLIA